MKSLLFTLFITITYLTTSMAQINDTVSYSLGVLIAKNMEQQGFDKIDLDVLSQAIAESRAGTAQIDIAQANQVMQRYQQEMMASKHAGNKSAGEAFLAENAKRAEVTTLPSGLQYEVLTEGSGAMPSPTDKVTTHYHGMLIDGTVFDSSVDRGEPATFGVNQVIQGWQEILPMMSEGAKYKVYIPYNLAYGENGAGASIPPFSALVFEIELISVN